MSWVAGVDGCRSGWLAVFLSADGREPPRLSPFARFADLLAAAEAPLRIAVDMPIGLPERIVGPGRGAERAVRRLLGARQSSVFAVPSRAAVGCADYGAACSAALATSEPPRRVSRQCFHLFPKIRELDALMTPELAGRVFETHPEVAFWRLNGEASVPLPKKVKGRPDPAGIEARRRLLEAQGFKPAFLRQRPPPGAGADDLVDAAACAVVALRLLRGQAEPFPDPPERDGKGLPVAIWA